MITTVKNTTTIKCDKCQKESIASKDRNIKVFDLEDKKLELESKIYEYSYNILILEKRYKLIENYLKNIEKLQELYSSLYKYEKASLNESRVPWSRD